MHASVWLVSLLKACLALYQYRILTHCCCFSSQLINRVKEGKRGWPVTYITMYTIWNHLSATQHIIESLLPDLAGQDGFKADINIRSALGTWERVSGHSHAPVASSRQSDTGTHYKVKHLANIHALERGQYLCEHLKKASVLYANIVFCQAAHELDFGPNYFLGSAPSCTEQRAQLHVLIAKHDLSFSTSTTYY